MVQLRDYQRECIEEMQKQKPGSYLIQMATGLGKTVTFANFLENFPGRALIISHRQELVKQPEKYFNCSYGIEMGSKRSKGQKIVSTTYQSMSRRLKKFKPDEFDIIITDEAHHSAAKSYKKIYSYFRTKYHFGFSATPNRGDKVGISDVYQDIIFERDLKWGIEKGWLSKIECKRVDIGFDIRGIRRNSKDFNESDLDDMVNIEECNEAITETYNKIAKGKTLIFAVSISHCEELQKKIPGSRVIHSKISDTERQEALKEFESGECYCLINCMILTEGTDLPMIETIIAARPTQNASLYNQMIGRGMRLFDGKDKLLLIDCVGNSKLDICTAPTLFGLKMDNVEEKRKPEIEGDLFELENIIEHLEDNPKSWINNIKTIDLWAKKQHYDTHGVNYIKKPNGDLILRVPNTNTQLYINKPNEFGNSVFTVGNKSWTMPIQKIFDHVFKTLCRDHQNTRQLWHTKAMARWKYTPITYKQAQWINKKMPEFDTSGLNKLEASQILNRLFAS